MSAGRLLSVSERWFRLLLRLYPPDFRDEMGGALVETYRDRAREALESGGAFRLAVVWWAAFRDSVRKVVSANLLDLLGVRPVSPFDTSTLTAVAVGLFAVALIACYLAARRVTGIEPERLLREGG